MKIDYNQLFFRDSNVVEFICTDTGRTYQGYIAGVFTQTFGGITYELGIHWADWKDIYDNLTYKDVPKVEEPYLLPTVVKTAECPVSISFPINNHGLEKVLGKVSHFHVDDNMTVGSGWFDCLLHEGIVDEDEWEGLKALQISIDWENITNLDKKSFRGEWGHFNIFKNIDLD